MLELVQIVIVKVGPNEYKVTEFSDNNVMNDDTYDYEDLVDYIIIHVDRLATR